MAASFTYKIDSFTLTKNGTLIFNDTFDDGVPPPDAPELFAGGPTDYVTTGTMTETDGNAVLDGSTSVNTESPNPAGGLFSANGAILLTNIDPTNTTNGLKSDDDFTVQGTFDFSVPDVGGAYGVRLTDRSGTQAGDDVIELVARTGWDGVLRVQLRELDFVNHEVSNIESFALNLTKLPTFDQITFRLTHDDANVGVITASFDLLSGGTVVQTVTFSATANIFGTETPLFSGDDENWTRAQFVAYEPDPAGPTTNTIEGTTGNDRLAGTNLVDQIYGNDGNDKLVALESNDSLYGGNGNDLLNGGLGADLMVGGAGNDTYLVDDIGDVVRELSVGGFDPGGNDTVESSISFSLGDSLGVENLVLTGRADINGAGNALNNQITGNAGSNQLNGGLGVDTLTGGKGNDNFVFVKGEANLDAITDFNGNGIKAGDTLEFVGYGAGATFEQFDATHWTITAADASVETITLLNGVSVHQSDYHFV
jgi:Ca2+-binding RTX toxin-like protein